MATSKMDRLHSDRVVTGLIWVMGPSVQFHTGDLQDVGESLSIAWRQRYNLSYKSR